MKVEARMMHEWQREATMEAKPQRIEWMEYAALTELEQRILDLLLEFPFYLERIANSFQSRFMHDALLRYEQSSRKPPVDQYDEDGFYFSHKQRLIFWRTVTQYAHHWFPEMHELIEQVSAVAAAVSRANQKERQTIDDLPNYKRETKDLCA